MKIIIDELPPTLNKTTQYPSLKWSRNDNQIFELHAQKKKSRRDFIEIVIEPCPRK